MSQRRTKTDSKKGIIENARSRTRGRSRAEEVPSTSSGMRSGIGVSRSKVVTGPVRSSNSSNRRPPSPSSGSDTDPVETPTVIGVDADSDGGNNDTNNSGGQDSNVSSYVLAGIMKHGVMETDEVKELIERTCSFFKFPHRDEYNTEEGVRALIQQINKDVNRYNMVVRQIRDEISGKRYYSIRMEKQNAMMKFQLTFKKPEVAVINECVQKMLRRDDSLSIPFTECVDIARKTGKMNFAASKAFITRVMKMAYFVKADKENDEDEDSVTSMTLGFRAVDELLGVIEDIYPGLLKRCALCTSPLLHGYVCQNCESVVHGYCCEDYVKRSQLCPGESCGAQWTGIGSLNRRKIHMNFAASQSSVEETHTAEWNAPAD